MAKDKEYKVVVKEGNEQIDVDRFYDLIAEIILETEEDKQKRR